ncbi:hypothetical protein ACFV2X_37160 [Streptomyces sp. NPDC059679]
MAKQRITTGLAILTGACAAMRLAEERKRPAHSPAGQALGA